LKFGIIDEVISEPLGGAHRNRWVAIDRVGDALYAQLQLMKNQSQFAAMRRQKFLHMGRSFLKTH